MYKILGFVGPSGCGKDTAAQYIGKKKGFHLVTLCTTRPKRDTEKGDEYHFFESDMFLAEVLNGNMINAQEFRGWYYGVSIEDLVENEVNVMAMNNEMVEQMMETPNKNINLKVVYIETNSKQRLLHILKREDEPDCIEVCRRYLSDVIDYETNEDLANSCAYFIYNNYDSCFKYRLTTLVQRLYDKD